MKKMLKRIIVVICMVIIALNLTNMDAYAANTKKPKASKITKVRLASDKKKVTIKWKKVKGVNGYRVYLYSGKWKAKKTVAKGSITKAIIKATYKQGKTYKFRVKTYKKVNGKKVWSKYSKTYKYKVPTTSVNVPGLKKEVTSTGTKLTWNTVKGADQYEIYRLIDGVYVKIATVKDCCFEDKTTADYSYKVIAVVNGSKKWIEPVYRTEKTWVVDKQEWTESVPVYEQKWVTICNQCKIDITDNVEAHMSQHLDNGESTNRHNELQAVQIGTRDVHHKEEGHWETYKVLVTAGYWK